MMSLGKKISKYVPYSALYHVQLFPMSDPPKDQYAAVCIHIKNISMLNSTVTNENPAHN